MADLSRVNECASWISSWKGHYKDRPGGKKNLARKLRWVADEQALNLKHATRHPHRDEYMKSVAMLEAAAREAEADVALEGMGGEGPVAHGQDRHG